VVEHLLLQPVGRFLFTIGFKGQGMDCIHSLFIYFVS
jgi:hypothetical protein